MERYSKYDAVIIGGGPAGIAAAIRSKELGLRSVLIENREILGGIPLQCIHPGFGIQYFKEDLTGTEFISKLLTKMRSADVNYLTRAHVHSIELHSHDEKIINVITPEGVKKLKTKTIIYAAGARERHIFETNIVGDRPDGIYTAGEAQTLMDIYGIMPGRRIVIVGSGDVGLIMARRFALEGAEVKAVVEMMPYPGGLIRNVVQCLQDYDIPLYLNHVVIKVFGGRRVEKVVVSKVDEQLRPIEGTEFELQCDTLILATGLVPNTDILEKIGVIIDPTTKGPIVNEFLETTVPGVFVAGNALMINDSVDNVVIQGELAAEGAYVFVQNDGIPSTSWKPVMKGRNIRLVIPHYISGARDVVFYARVQAPERSVEIRVPEVDFKKKLLSVRPAEMIALRLSKELLASLKSSKVTLEVRRL
ncbi:pyridine nucleotide-disulfide oxidoreductase [Candidatus Bathyarchaeota archaeon]|nr:MAG: pyridine nucleotide-disulfide oxidoreductase [Thermococci archaeon]RLI45710.1 MAG: pyridine nucleotide-disulfide oxidoreductase [Candidatus Bathyarchaeota archaeon]